MATIPLLVAYQMAMCMSAGLCSGLWLEPDRGDLLVTPSPPIEPDTVNSMPLKRDVFMSRGWGAGGMPFSILYMHPKGARTTQPAEETPQVQQGEARASKSVVLQKTGGEEFGERVAPRAAAQVQVRVQGTSYLPNQRASPPPQSTTLPRAPHHTATRRQYLIIPQLFVSYGWGPLGK